jgi:hypothetical protein
MAASLPFDHSRLDDASAVAFARADVLVCADDRTACRLGDLAATYYGFWNNGSGTLLEATVSPDYTDKTLPVGRQQGREVWLMPERLLQGLPGRQSEGASTDARGRSHHQPSSCHGYFHRRTQR